MLTMALTIVGLRVRLQPGGQTILGVSGSSLHQGNQTLWSSGGLRVQPLPWVSDSMVPSSVVAAVD